MRPTVMNSLPTLDLIRAKLVLTTKITGAEGIRKKSANDEKENYKENKEDYLLASFIFY